MKAIETTATIQNSNQLILDTSVPENIEKVRLIILLPEEDDIEEKEWLKAASLNPAFDFLKDSKEDIYTEKDGKPFNYKR